MSANSLLRRVVKKTLYPLLSQNNYQYIQAAAKALDIRRGSWSEPELDLIPFAVKPGEVAIDIGANFGLYTYHLSRALGPTGKVYSFEPVPFTYQTLKKVCSLLVVRNAELLSYGCSDKNGTITFDIPVQESGALSAGLAHIGTRNDQRPGKSKHARYEKNQSISCQVVSLDDFLPDGLEVSLIKCDIEGAEILAFNGAKQLIEKNKPTVICEINPWFLEGFGVRLADLLDFFFQKGYGCYLYQNSRLIEVSLSEIVEDNYIFIHSSCQKRFSKIL